jgi:hypothetical protein
VWANRIKQWTFRKRDKTIIRKVKQMVVERVWGGSTSVPRKVPSEGAGSTGKNEPSGLSTENPVKNKLRL